jgi:hypothetical protein
VWGQGPRMDLWATVVAETVDPGTDGEGIGSRDLAPPAAVLPPALAGVQAYN